MVTDPVQARQRVLRYFDSLPTLSFSHLAGGQLEFQFPKFQKSDELTDLFNQRRASARFKDIGFDSGAPNALDPLFNSLAHSVRKFRYGHTAFDDWQDYFRFSKDRLTSNERGRYEIISAPANGSGVNQSFEI